MKDTSASPTDSTYKPKIENPEFFRLVEEHDIIDRGFINDLLEEFENNALDVLATMIQSGIAPKQKLCQLWCDSIGIAHVDLEKTIFQENIVNIIPERIARMYYAIPVYQMGNTVTIATATPDNKEIENILRNVASEPVSLVFALPQDIEASIDKEYAGNSPIFEFFHKLAASKIFKAQKDITSHAVEDAGGEAVINQLHVALILFALTRSASEIHITMGLNKSGIDLLIPFSEKLHFNIDKTICELLVLRLKGLAGIAPVDTSTVQYGRIRIPTPGKKIDLKFENRPGNAGPTVILKLTGVRPFRKAVKLEYLYLSRPVSEEITRLLEQSKGHILIAGPSKSGKSTLAYAMLGERVKHFKNNLTIEHAIKFFIPGVDQTFVNPDAGIATIDLFESGIAQKSNTIYIQHIEAPGVPQRVSEAVRSGHFILSGIKADNTLDALEKIIRLGAGDSVTAIITQQLVARLCDICKSEYLLKPDHLQTLFDTDGKTNVYAWGPKGCAYCNESGFSGLIGVHELLVLDDPLRKMISDKAEPVEILNSVKPGNIHTMHYDALKKVLRGLTTFDEIHRLPFS